MQWANAKPHIDGHLTRKTSPKLVDDSVIASRFASNIASQQCKRSLGNASIAKTRCMSLFVLVCLPRITNNITPGIWRAYSTSQGGEIVAEVE